MPTRNRLRSSVYVSIVAYENILKSQQRSSRLGNAYEAVKSCPNSCRVQLLSLCRHSPRERFNFSGPNLTRLQQTFSEHGDKRPPTARSTEYLDPSELSRFRLNHKLKSGHKPISRMRSASTLIQKLVGALSTALTCGSYYPIDCRRGFSQSVLLVLTASRPACGWRGK